MAFPKRYTLLFAEATSTPKLVAFFIEVKNDRQSKSMYEIQM